MPTPGYLSRTRQTHRKSLRPAALREGAQTLPSARLAGLEREIRMLALYRERLLDMRTRLSNELRWQLRSMARVGAAC